MTGLISALAFESGIPASVLEAEPVHYLDGMIAYLKRKADAVSGDEDLDWDDTFGSDN